MELGDSDINIENENRRIEIKDALTCFICTAKVYDPMMCPQCKKLACSKCIKKWFVEQQHEKCPYCQTPLSYDKMINLPFMNQLSEYFIKEIENKEEEAHRTFISSNSKNMNLNQIIDEDEDDNLFNINNDKKINNDKDEDDNILSRTQFFPHKFQKNEYSKESNLSLSKNGSFGANNKVNINKEFCFKHRKDPIEYYCLNCNTKHCAKCLLIMSKESKIHQGHKIIDIEKRNKYDLDSIYKEINSLSDVTKTLSQYKINIDIEEKIMEKKEDFYKKMIDEFQKAISSKIMEKSTKLSLDKQKIEVQLNLIEGVKNNHKEALINFIEREDDIGLGEYRDKIKDFKDTDKYEHNDVFDIFINPSLKFFETDFIDVEIQDYDENIGDVIGELNFNIDGLDKEIQLRFNQDAIDEILINLQINDFDENQISYFCYLILKNKNCITSAILNEKMVHNGILILGKTIIKNSLKNIIDVDHKCHVKFILAEIKI